MTRPKRPHNPIDEEERRLERFANSLAGEMGIPVHVRSMEAKTHPTGIPFGRERVQAFALNFSVDSGKWPAGVLDRTYVLTHDLSDDAVRKTLQKYLAKVAERLRASENRSG